jgi:hypothetical protein
MRSDKSEERNAENYSQRAELFSAMRKNKARQLNYQAMIFEHFSSLCRSYGAALQNTFDSPRVGEQFIFHNYVTLSKAFNRYEKSWLVTLLPHIFQWESQDSCDSVNGDGLLMPNFGATKEANRDASSNASRVISPPQAAITPNVIRGAIQDVKISCDKLVSLESVGYLYRSPTWQPGEPSPLITDGGVQLSMEQATTKEWNELRGVCRESGIGIGHDQITSHKVQRTPVSIKIDRKDARNYHKELKDGLLSISL